MSIKPSASGICNIFRNIKDTVHWTHKIIQTSISMDRSILQNQDPITFQYPFNINMTEIDIIFDIPLSIDSMCCSKGLQVFCSLIGVFCSLMASLPCKVFYVPRCCLYPAGVYCSLGKGICCSLLGLDRSLLRFSVPVGVFHSPDSFLCSRNVRSRV